jgi:hypothetical protein
MFALCPDLIDVTVYKINHKTSQICQYLIMTPKTLHTMKRKNYENIFLLFYSKKST